MESEKKNQRGLAPEELNSPRQPSQSFYNAQCVIVWTIILPIVVAICASFWLSLFLTGISQGESSPGCSAGLPLLHLSTKRTTPASKDRCKLTCSLEVVESIPENLTFNGHIPRSTFDAWSTLIKMAEQEIDIAAYKSSLRGKHVLGDAAPSSQMGEEIFDDLVNAGAQRNVAIRMVENYPPKDPGDNEDGKGLQRRSAVERRSLHYSKIFGGGTMHSKFFVVDQKHLYLGSANLDWRSLNQKMELGVLITNCPCLAEDLRRVFDTYWALTKLQNATSDFERTKEAGRLVTPMAEYNKEKPLRILHHGEKTDVYFATSPVELNSETRTWDLDAILATINGAQHYLYIHVMDYIPMIVYREPQKYWPIIDDAIRTAVMERGVEVKLLAAALHFVPQTLRFLKSLQAINGASDGAIDVKIFHVPPMTETQSVIARERRTHNKFMVSEDTVVIGTSNWSGDYFVGNTGVALVVKQTRSTKRRFVQEMKDIFFRDWNSAYAHTLSSYITNCLHSKEGTINQCAVAKQGSKKS